MIERVEAKREGRIIDKESISDVIIEFNEWVDSKKCDCILSKSPIFFREECVACFCEEYFENEEWECG